ncbi:hypothetical protein BDV41DRAFT_86813 [Aspergillus transmontanensis]|uniref:T6SS Phospholipase effector Tle1-like catalytic domain-containing protein n=1 Tax=Aspergillus transmontanensis TaxID=1034304 RepID=A0A5N6VEL2_9EURO|nr:hypothetical protein BDV41DRAFT_86813 [Aspergillus transmontanensis]
MNHFEQNDEIYLFGSANGAYAAFLLADLIEYAGVLTAGDEDRLPKVWEVFRNWINSKRDPIIMRRSFLGIGAFRKSFDLPDGRVAFIGLFDAVYNQSFRNSQSAPIYPISYHNIRHAVSVDERCTDLRPILLGSQYAQNIQEIWFPGAHHDMIGSLTSSCSPWTLSHIPFVWMVSEAMKAGLHLYRGVIPISNRKESFENDPFRGLEGDTIDSLDFRRLLSEASMGALHDALSFDSAWSTLTVLKRRVKECLISSIHNGSDRLFAIRGSPRKVPPGAAVHLSVLLRVKLDPNYRPSNVFNTPEQLEAEARNWTLSRIEDNLMEGFYI